MSRLLYIIYLYIIGIIFLFFFFFKEKDFDFILHSIRQTWYYRDYLWLYDLLFIAGYLARKPLNLLSTRGTQKQKKSQLLPNLSLIYVSLGEILWKWRERNRERWKTICLWVCVKIGLWFSLWTLTSLKKKKINK